MSLEEDIPPTISKQERKAQKKARKQAARKLQQQEGDEAASTCTKKGKKSSDKKRKAAEAGTEGTEDAGEGDGTPSPAAKVIINSLLHARRLISLTLWVEQLCG